MPDLQNCIGVTQGENHADDVFNHLMYCIDAGRDLEYTDTTLMLGILFHDIGKWKTRSIQKGKVRFYKHEVVGAVIAYEWMKEHGFPKNEIQRVVCLVRHHMFRFELDANDKTIRKWLFDVGKNNWEDLLKLRLADRKGNRAKSHLPLRTKAFINLENQIKRIINSGIIVFKEDLAITEEDMSFMSKQEKKNAFPNLIGLCNKEPQKNKKEYLIDYCERIYKK